MSKEQEITAKALRFKARTSAPAEVRSSVDAEVRQSVAAEVRSLPPRLKPVRLNVDVSPVVRAALRGLCAELEVELGGTPVSGQDVLRSLIRRVLDDPDARAQLARDLGVPQ